MEVRVSPTWLRVGAGLAAFVLVALVGMGALGGLDFEEARSTFAIVMVVAVPVGLAVYALVEYAQTRRLDSITHQFDTRTLVLMPVAIALNIALGTIVAEVLKVPIWLDSIGTILVAALAGPLAGAATGFLANVIWTYLAPPPFASPFAVPFAVVAVVVGLLAGTFARWGWLRPRRGASGQRLALGGLVAIAAMALMAVLALRIWTVGADEGAMTTVAWLATAVAVLGTALGLALLLVRWQDQAAAYIVVAGVTTGIVAALIAAPIAASLFAGVTGSGADFVIAAMRAAGADLEQAVLGQSLLFDPVDKTITYFVVYLILGAMATRTKARFPQGRYLLPIDGPEDDRATTSPRR